MLLLASLVHHNTTQIPAAKTTDKTATITYTTQPAAATSLLPKRLGTDISDQAMDCALLIGLVTKSSPEVYSLASIISARFLPKTNDRLAKALPYDDIELATPAKQFDLMNELLGYKPVRIALTDSATLKMNFSAKTRVAVGNACTRPNVSTTLASASLQRPSQALPKCRSSLFGL